MCRVGHISHKLRQKASAAAVTLGGKSDTAAECAIA
jgi:hypothetical protein